MFNNNNVMQRRIAVHVEIIYSRKKLGMWYVRKVSSSFNTFKETANLRLLYLAY